MNQEKMELDKKMDKALHFTAGNLLESGHNPKPVLLHSFRVAELLYKLNYPEEIVIAGILHDLIEDTDIEQNDIEKEFSNKVANIVDAVSFNPHIEDKLEQAKLLFENCIKYGNEALIVKCSDLIDNINYVQHADDDLKPKLLKKYHLFIDMSKEYIGKEKIYELLDNKIKELL